MNDHNIPPSLQGHAAHQQRYLQTLHAQPYYDLMAPAIERFLTQIIRSGAFYLRVHESTLEGILHSQSIKSLMEVGQGATNGGRDTRMESTAALYGCDVTKLKPEEYPKYGFLSQSDPEKDLLLNAQMWCQYGDVSIKLNKERLLHRTTLTVGNSLNFGRCYALVPTRVDEVKATCLCGPRHTEKGLVRMKDPMGLYAYFTTLILEGKLTERNFPRIESIAGEAASFFEYFELQYHGPLSLTDDVERIDLQAPSPSPELKALQQQFEDIGVPFYLHK